MTVQFTEAEQGLEDRFASQAAGSREEIAAGTDAARMLPVHRGVFSEEIRDTFGQSAGDFDDFRAYMAVDKVDRMIASAAQKWNVDPIAIIGAIVWEGFVNPRVVSRRGAGLGKMHYREWWFLFEGEPLAKQLEDVGYIPSLSMEERKERLLQPEVAIEYIAAAMHAFSVIAEKYGHSVRDRPEILCTAYNRFKLDTWDEHLAEKRKGEPLRPGNMGTWVAQHLDFLRFIYPSRKWFPIDPNKMDVGIRTIDEKL